MVWLCFIDVLSRILALSWHYHKVDEEDKTFYLDHRMSKSLGSDQVNIYMEAPILIPPNW
jgi:hypothetical protein